MSVHSQHAAAVIQRPLNLDSLEVYRDYNGDFVITIPISGADAVAEYRLHAVATDLTGLSYWPSNVYHMYGIRVVLQDRAYRLVALPSALEYAIMIAPAGSAAGIFNFFGGVHQNQARTALSVELDSVDISGLGRGRWVAGTELVVDQDANTIEPQDMATVIGATNLVHTFNTSVMCQVDASHTFVPGYEIKTAYTAMLSTIDQDGRGVDTVRIGGNTPLTRHYDDGDYDVGSLEDEAIGYHSSAHPYRVKMFLPTGGPDLAGSWATTQGLGMWFKDYSTTNNNIGKVYVNLVGDTPITAANFAHQQRYSVYT